MEKKKAYEGWIAVFETSTDYEADMVRDRLDSNDVPAIVLTQRDHAFNLTIGKLARVLVMVPPEQVGLAKDILAEAPLTDEELNEASDAANPYAPAAHTPDEDTLLDSGIEKITFPGPPDPEDEDPLLA